ncbi:MAG TPA: SUF system NifU family Fe-S cluster assembly protein [Alphaproteobacteria bacterium]|nr:SUF system NifU family Fe-S cluster assembly protein [Alphaproteobacteria bacterium]
MSELRDLYQEMILDHGKRPRNFGPLPAANRHADGHNPLCGDKVTVAVLLQDGKVADVRFTGAGCAISMASASLMTDAIKGRTEAELREMFRKFHTGLTAADDAQAASLLADLDKLAVFSGVREYPVRVKCATLPWHTLIAALDRAAQPAKTE